MKKQIIKNVSTNYLATALQTALGFLIVPFLVFKLGKEAFGLIAFSETMITFSQIFNGSLRSSLSRYATASLSQDRQGEFAEYIATGRGILYGCAALVFTVGAMLSLNFPILFNSPPEFTQQAQLLLLLITISFTTSITNDAFWAILYANQRFDLINISNSAATTIRAALIFILFSVLPHSYANLITYGVVHLMMTWGQNFIVYLWSRQIMPNFKINMKIFNLEKAKELIYFGGHTALGNVSFLLYDNFMNIFINISWGPALNAVYAISTKLPVLLRRLFLETSWSLAPTFVDLVARKDKDRLERLFLMYTKAISIISAPICFVLFYFAKDIILLWVGPDFDLAARLLPYFAISMMLAIPTGICNCVAGAYGKIKIPSRINLASSVLAVILGVYLSKGMGQGLLGIAMSSLIVSMLGINVFLPFYVCRLAGISHKRYWMDSILKPSLTAFLFIGTATLPNTVFHGNVPFVVTVMILAAMGVIYLGATYYLILSRSEKEFFREMISHRNRGVTAT